MSAKHEVDVVSLVFGVLFLAAAAFFGLVTEPALPTGRWILPVVLIVLGVLGLLGTIGRRRGRRTEMERAGTEAPVDLSKHPS